MKISGSFDWTLLGALSIARYSVRIMTPYFLPDPAVVSALNLAAMRGVQVDILLPSCINLPFVLWASRAMWSQVLQHGCRIWLTPPPFDHSKLMLVDGCWVLLGSANWDARSLRLNFEFNLECYNAILAQRLEQWVEINPLVPEGAMDYFCLDGLRYHDFNLTILYDRTGKRFGKGAGVRVFADGEQIGASPRLQWFRVSLLQVGAREAQPASTSSGRARTRASRRSGVRRIR